MNLKLLLPTEVLIDEEVTKVVAEAENGSFCLLPRHVDFVAALIPGILSYTSDDKGEQYVAVGAGVLVKSGSLVRVSAQDAVWGGDLGRLRQTVAERFLVLDDREKVARAAIAKLEADFVRRFLNFGEPRGG
ncbi:F0F1 ATP synthase subunit epsilon [Symmachiella dynata]|uniref:F0F1 ATP synthase subunit epsilon n=1 Tax=Symmachiella dynata TaxID=2527995 RepID=UPI0030ECFF19|tara:strand:- start:314 stop:709 length:396 start_codon:yes stop_codon:yes gene_type:complete